MALVAAPNSSLGHRHLQRLRVISQVESSSDLSMGGFPWEACSRPLLLFFSKWPKPRVLQTWRNGVGRIKGSAFPVLLSFQKTRRTPPSSAWLPRHVRK